GGRAEGIGGAAGYQPGGRGGRGAPARREPPAEGAAEGEAGHEGDEHGGERVHGVAEDEPEHAEPDDLIDEPGRAREEEGGGDDEQREEHQAPTGLTPRERKERTGSARLTRSRAGSPAARRLATRVGSPPPASHRRGGAAPRAEGARGGRGPPSRSSRAPGTRWWR